MFADLQRVNQRPRPFEFYTTADLWTDEHVSAQMLACHLDPDTDLASRNAAFIARSVDWIATRFAAGEGTRLIDFGCGPGLYTNALARRGVQVTGIDFSRRSLDYASQAAAAEGLDVNYILQNYLEFVSDQQFDVVLMIFCDYCVLSPMQRRRLLRTFRAILKPEGRVLLDVCSVAALEQRQEAATYEVCPEGGFWSPDRYYCFLNTFRYPHEQVTVDKYTIVEAARTRTIYNWLQYFRPECLQQEFAEAGLEIEDRYSDVAAQVYSPDTPEFAVVARARGK